MQASMRQLTPESFPSLLREINDPPSHLYIRGTLPPDTLQYLCVVGSRKATAYGREVCSELIKGLRGYPIVIVSGLALGIDGLAHQAAIDAGLFTIAVPGSGLGDAVLYPRTHYRLAEHILEAGGALISEFPEEYRARRESFVQRNRIMAGLSHATLVIEAELRSGTLITARLATEYNRDVYTIPGPIFSSTSEGPHYLIRSGATPVCKSEDILEALHIDAGAQQSINKTQSLSKEEQRVIELLSSPCDRDILTKKLNLSSQETNVLLSAMELKGLITQRMGAFHRTFSD